MCKIELPLSGLFLLFFLYVLIDCAGPMLPWHILILEVYFSPSSPFRRFLCRVDVFHHVEPALSV